MKNAILATMVLASVPAVAQQAAPAPTLVPGSDVKIESLSTGKWIQGEPLKAFEPGKVYMFECWATWCGPCVAAIPHVNDLHNKFKDKGLRVVGVNVWEDGLEKVEKFVKGKGAGMSYPVVYTGKGSAFESEWLKPAGVTGIPRALIVKDGKLVLGTHPSKVTDELIEALIAGGDAQKQVMDNLEKQESASRKMIPLMRSFSEASQQRDAAAMEKTIAEVEALDPKMAQLPLIKIDLLLAKKDTDGAIKALDSLKDEKQRNMAVSMFMGKIAKSKDADAFPAEFVKAIAKGQTNARSHPTAMIMTSIVQSKAGDKEAAIQTAKAAMEAAKQPSARPTPVVPFEKFIKALEDGSSPTMSEFYQWMAEEMKAARPMPAPAPAPVKPATK